MSSDPQYGTFELIAYEAMTDFGFVLPLYKRSTSANSWYVAVSAKPYDLNSYIVRFEQYFPESPNLLNSAQSVSVHTGDRYVTIFYWEGRPIIGDVLYLGVWLEDHSAELLKYLTVSAFDIALYSRSISFQRIAKQVLTSVRKEIGKSKAADWCELMAASQAAQVDLGIATSNHWSELTPAEVERFGGLVGQCRTVRVGSEELAFVYPDKVSSVVPMENMEVTHFRRFVALAEISGRQPVLLSESGLTRKLEAFKGAFDNPVPNKKVHEGTKTEQPLSAADRPNTEVRVNVSGVQIDIGQALINHVTDSLTSLASGLGHSSAFLDVVFSRNAHEFDCTINLSKGTLAGTSRANDTEIYSAFEKSASKLRSQLLKLNDKSRGNYRDAAKLKRTIGGVDYGRDAFDNE